MSTNTESHRTTAQYLADLTTAVSPIVEFLLTNDHTLSSNVVVADAALTPAQQAKMAQEYRVIGQVVHEFAQAASRLHAMKIAATTYEERVGPALNWLLATNVDYFLSYANGMSLCCVNDINLKESHRVLVALLETLVELKRKVTILVSEISATPAPSNTITLNT